MQFLGSPVNTNASSEGKKEPETRKKNHINGRVISTDELAIESCDQAAPKKRLHNTDQTRQNDREFLSKSDYKLII